MSRFPTEQYRDDIVVMDIIAKNPRDPHTAVYHGGPLHGLRFPYDPKHPTVIVHDTDAAPRQYGSFIDPPPCMKTVTYRAKTVRRAWTIKHGRQILKELKAVGCTAFGRIVREPVYERITEHITFAEYGIAMVAEGWTGEPAVEEKDCYGREIVDAKQVTEEDAAVEGLTLSEAGTLIRLLRKTLNGGKE